MAIAATLQTHRALGDASRYAILEQLRVGGAMDSRQLGHRLGLHPNTVRSHAELLIEAGLIRTRVAEPRGRGRPRLLYEATPAGLEGGGGSWRLLAEALAFQFAEGPEGQASAEAAGRGWGGQMGRKQLQALPPTGENTLNALLGVLSEIGFDPLFEDASGWPRLWLQQCPFAELAQVNRSVCAVHLGLIRGALEAMNAPFEVLELKPFVGPSGCLAELARVPEPGSGVPAEGPLGEVPVGQ